MPTQLREHQHELLGEDDQSGLVFGTEDTGYLTLTRPVITASEQRVNDTDRAQEDGRVFGRDYLTAKAVTFEVGVLTDIENVALGVTDPHRRNLDALNEFEEWWLDPRWRDTPWSMAVLRSCEAGQTWRCYGRPRRYDEVVGRLTVQGYTPVVAEFALIDNRWYSDVEYAADVALVAAPESGLVAPLVAPLQTVAAAVTTEQFLVGGTRPTWPVVEFHGPVTDPVLTVGPLKIGLDMFIPEGEHITVDTRPWSRAVTRASDGAGFAGALSPQTPRMAVCTLVPGSHSVSFRGTSATGTARARLRWRSARSRP